MRIALSKVKITRHFDTSRRIYLRQKTKSCSGETKNGRGFGFQCLSRLNILRNYLTPNQGFGRNQLTGLSKKS